MTGPPPPADPPPAHPPPAHPPPAHPPPLYATPPPAPLRRRRTGLIVGLVLAGAVLVVVGAVAVGLGIRERSLAAAGVGDCLHHNPTNGTFERRDCGVADADSSG